MPWERYEGTGWEGWVEVTDHSINLEDGEVISCSRHRFSAKNLSSQNGSFEVTYEHKLSRDLGEHGLQFIGQDTETKIIPCNAGKTVGHSIAEDDHDLEHVREVRANGNPNHEYKLETYVRVHPRDPIQGNEKKLEHDIEYP